MGVASILGEMRALIQLVYAAPPSVQAWPVAPLSCAESSPVSGSAIDVTGIESLVTVRLEQS